MLQPMRPPVQVKPREIVGDPPIYTDPSGDPSLDAQPAGPTNPSAATFANRQRMLREWQARNPSRQRVMGYDPTNNPAAQPQVNQLTQVDPTGSQVAGIPLPTGFSTGTPQPRLYQDVEMPNPGGGLNDFETPTNPGMPQPMPKPGMTGGMDFEAPGKPGMPQPMPKPGMMGGNKPMRSPFDKRGI